MENRFIAFLLVFSLAGCLSVGSANYPTVRESPPQDFAVFEQASRGASAVRVSGNHMKFVDVDGAEAKEAEGCGVFNDIMEIIFNDTTADPYECIPGASSIYLEPGYHCLTVHYQLNERTWRASSPSAKVCSVFGKSRQYVVDAPRSAKNINGWSNFIKNSPTLREENTGQIVLSARQSSITKNGQARLATTQSWYKVFRGGVRLNPTSDGANGGLTYYDVPPGVNTFTFGGAWGVNPSTMLYIVRLVVAPDQTLLIQRGEKGLYVLDKDTGSVIHGLQ